MTQTIRATLTLAGFLALTLPLMPVQWLLLKTGHGWARRFPNWYHRQVCRVLGIRVHIHGAISDETPVLLVSNHITWLDIPVLSAVAPVSFVAKKEVAGWPLVGALAQLQRTVFVDRGRRSAVGLTRDEMAARLRDGGHVVLFAEGTSGDGNTVLPFRSSLFAVAKDNSPSRQGEGDPTSHDAVVQTIAISYGGFHGLPLTRAERPKLAWYGDMEMTSHAWALLKSGPIDVHIDIGAPVPLDEFPDRKALARFTEDQIRTAVVHRGRGRPLSETVAAVAPVKSRLQSVPSNASKWV